MINALFLKRPQGQRMALSPPQRTFFRHRGRLKIGSGWQDIKADMERMRQPNEDGHLGLANVNSQGHHCNGYSTNRKVVRT